MIGGRRVIDLNADVGEGFGPYSMGCDEELIPLVSSVNVACGFHAGDPQTIDRAVGIALRHGVAVGAHPGHFDLRGFGRRTLLVSAEQIETDVLYQVGAVAAFARAHGGTLTHVKPHGALYNQAARDETLARAIARAVARYDRNLRLVGLASSQAMRRAAEAEGLAFVAEVFADRAYQGDGSLMPRELPAAVLRDAAAAAAQAVRLAQFGTVIAADGSEVRLNADTICLHGDHPWAAESARVVHRALRSAGFELRAPEP